jgi:hypothetical protein
VQQNPHEAQKTSIQQDFLIETCDNVMEPGIDYVSDNLLLCTPKHHTKPQKLQAWMMR